MRTIEMIRILRGGDAARILEAADAIADRLEYLDERVDIMSDGQEPGEEQAGTPSGPVRGHAPQFAMVVHGTAVPCTSLLIGPTPSFRLTADSPQG